MLCGSRVDEAPAKMQKEGNVLFNDALNTFHLRLYGVRYNFGKGPLG